MSADATTTAAAAADTADSATSAAADAAVAASEAAANAADSETPSADAAAGAAAAADGTKQEVTYTLTLPENSTLDPAVLERTALIAKARGLTNEQAQAMVDLANGEVATHLEAAMKAHAPGGAAWEKTVNDWKAQTLADESLGKTVQEREATIDRGKAVLRKFAEGNPEKAAKFTAFLETSGLGSHPDAVGFIAWLGTAMGEGSHVPAGKPSEGKKGPEERWYPDLAAKAASA